MPNITIRVDEETYRMASLRASELGTTAPDVLRAYLAVFAQRSVSAPSAADKAAAKRGDAACLAAGSSGDTRGEWLRALLRLPIEERRRILRHASFEVDEEETALWDHLPWADEEVDI